MANTYTQLNIHAVFCVQGRENILDIKLRERLYSYISGTFKNMNLYPLAVNGFSDHVHVFFELSPELSVSKIIQDIKANSSKWINENRLVMGKFSWQRGYGAFSYARSQRDTVISYIMNQENHHKKNTFKEEYLELLRKFDVKYNDQYLFEFYEM